MPGLFGLVSADANEKIESLCKVLKHYNWQKVEKTYLNEGKIGIGRVYLKNGFNENTQLNANTKNKILLQGYIFLHGQSTPILSPDKLVEIYDNNGFSFDNISSGMFNLLIFDENKMKIILINDRFGLLPLFYYTGDDEFIFSPEMKGILNCKHEKSFNLNFDALSEYLYFGHLIGEKTYFDEIKLLPPASVLEYDLLNCKMNIYSYWKPEYSENGYESTSENKLVDELYKSIKKSLDRFSMLNKNFSVLLSGGLDSRTIYALSDMHINSYTFGFPWSSEIKYSKRVTNIGQKGSHFIWTDTSKTLLRTAEENTELIENLQGLNNSRLIEVGKKIRHNNEEIVFDGYLGDVLFGGTYFTKRKKNIRDTLANILFGYNEFVMKDDSKKIENILYKSHESLSDNTLQKILSSELYEKIKTRARKGLITEIEEAKKEIGNIKYTENFIDYFLINYSRGRRYIKLGGILLNNFIETVCPFFDYEVFDTYLKIRPKYRAFHRIYFMLYSKKLDEYARIPSTVTKVSPKTPFIFHNFMRYWVPFYSRRIHNKLNLCSCGKLCKRKDNYVDYDKWLRDDNEIKSWLNDILINGYLVKDGFVNLNGLQEIFNKHFSYKKNYSSLLLRIASLELWYRKNHKFFLKLL